jgi:hypothetical protein
MMAGFFAAFPDLHFTMGDQIDAGDKVALWWVAEGRTPVHWALHRPLASVCASRV